jgi:hypothetical protein
MDFIDTAIIGSGPTGLFAALALEEQGYKPAIFEQGKIRSLSDLEIPTLVEVGFGGAGAASDGKLNLSRGQGGNLGSLIEEELLHGDLAELILQKYISFGGESGYRTKTNRGNELILKAEQEGMILIPSDIVHFGTDVCKTIIENMYNYLSGKASIFLRTKIESIEREGDGFTLITAKGEKHYADNIVLAVGREQNSWAAEQCRNMGIEVESNGADVGIRVEVPNEILAELVRQFYEAKIKYKTSGGLEVRTFCMCPSGFVINDDGKVNGHSYRYRKSDNTNVALLATLKGIREPDKYLREWLSKPLGEYGRPIVAERYGDFKNGVSNPKLPWDNKVKPTLAEEYWVAGNIHKVLPPEICDAIREFIEKIGVIAPAFNADSTLLYGVEGKNYALRTSLNVDKSDPKMPTLRTSVPGLYVGGDGSGWTRGLYQSSVMGWLIGYDIARRAA